VTALARSFFARRWRGWLLLRDRLRGAEETLHLFLAALVGVVASSANFLFYLASESVKWLALHRPGDPVEIAEMLPPWARLAAPALGGLAAGLVLQWGLRLVGSQGTTNLLEVVVAGDGRMPFRTTLVKVFSSLVSVGTGAAIGREGSIVNLGAMLASKGGSLLGFPPYRLRLLLACGAAAGLAAAYNAPVAGAVFAAQIVLGNFSMNLFAPLVCASVVAAVASRSFFGIEPWYRVPEFDFTRLGQLPWFLVLGALCGGVGAGFLTLLQRAESFFRRTSLPLYARLGTAGLAVGALAWFMPEVWGNGYVVASRILAEHAEYSLVFLGGLLLAKLLATVLTVGAGTVGGVFTPTLFLGAALGSILGHVLHTVGLAPVAPAGVFALVGMGSMLAATTHSPLLAIIAVFEISLNYSLIPPLMLACAVGTLVGKRFHPASVYTEPLRAKGLLYETENEQLGAAIQRTVADLLRPPVPPLQENTSFRDIADRFLTSPNNYLPVVNQAGQLVGVVALQDLKAHLSTGQGLEGVIALDVMRPPPSCLVPRQTIQEALPVLLASDIRNIPVVDNLRDFRLAGCISRGEALDQLSEAIAARCSATSPRIDK
jgi:CIC family chloride channel protein